MTWMRRTTGNDTSLRWVHPAEGFLQIVEQRPGEFF